MKVIRNGHIYCANRREAFEKMLFKTSKYSNCINFRPQRTKVFNEFVPAEYVLNEQDKCYHLRVCTLDHKTVNTLTIHWTYE